MSSYRDDKRKDDALRAEQAREDRRLAAEAQIKAGESKAAQQRENAAAAEERRAARQREEDERKARLAKQARADKVAARKVAQQQRIERRSARRQALTPGNIYRLGTLALVTASALGSLPAQILHFADISPMLLPLPLSIEGAAWVFAAGVAFADARKLPGWVRWLLRGFILAAAGFAASINFSYGKSLPHLTGGQALTAGIGLAAVSLLGPLMFEIRQWVSTLDEKTGTPEDKKRRKQEAKQDKERQEHLARRQKHHKDIALAAEKLQAALPYGSVDDEQAFAAAWRIHRGAEPGLSGELYAAATNSKVQLGAAFELGEHVRPELLRTGMLAAALDPFGTRPAGGVPTLGPLSILGPAQGATTQAGIGSYGSETPTRETPHMPPEDTTAKALPKRSEDELTDLLPAAHKTAAELVAEGKQISAAGLAKRLQIRREDAVVLRDRVIEERKLRAV